MAAGAFFVLAAVVAGWLAAWPGIVIGVFVALINDSLLKAGVELSIRPGLRWKGAFLLLGTGTAARLGLAAAAIWVSHRLAGVPAVVGFVAGVSSQLVAYVAAAMRSERG